MYELTVYNAGNIVSHWIFYTLLGMIMHLEYLERNGTIYNGFKFELI